MDNRINSPASDRIMGAARIRCEAEAAALVDPPRATQADMAYAEKLEQSVFDTIAPAIIGKGGELVPDAAGHMPTMGCRDTVASPTYLTVQASRTRLQLSEDAHVLDLALDLSDTIGARDSIEKMIAGQMAVLHRVSMKAGAVASDSLERCSAIDMRYRDQHTIQAQRAINTAARASAEFQNCALTLQRLRTGGKQSITVTHIQNTQVNEGGQAVVTGGGVAQGAGGGGPEMSSNPMQAASKMHQSPRCRAKSKRSKQGCKAPAVRGWEVCRMHGAHGGAPPGKANGNFTNGYFTKQAQDERREARAAVKTVRALRRMLADLDA